MTQPSHPSIPAPPASTGPSPATEIRVEDLHKSFGSKVVLSGVNLEIQRGEMVAIIGGSGCGKTVLLRHMIGHFIADQGRVWVADHEREGAPLVDLATLGEKELDELRRHWAMVFQGNALFSGTVYENIALALEEVKGMEKDKISQVVHDVVEAVGLNPDRDTQLNRESLSGGMSRRVGIARALALDPVIIFYDEPTSGLDPHLARQIHELIRSVHERKTASGLARTSIIVTHDKDLLHRLQPRTIMLHQGRVLFDGKYEAFLVSDAPEMQPYLEMMPGLHQRTNPTGESN